MGEEKIAKDKRFPGWEKVITSVSLPLFPGPRGRSPNPHRSRRSVDGGRRDRYLPGATLNLDIYLRLLFKKKKAL